MELVGRIDRVDKAESSKGLPLRIVDYKSSDRGLIWLRCITGSLCKCSHILTYRLHSEDWLGMKATPAGVLYFHIHDPMIQASLPMGLDEIEQEILRNLK
ncbi:PD-(D/E)XK nuclease family protein [Bacillus velezensis]|nr:PD-(D/E)XK nuclease family protein [Bacillus velezensis]